MDFTKAKDYILPRMQKELPGDLYYHRLQHSLDVLQAAEKLIVAEDVDYREGVLIKTAAVFHDCGFLKQSHHNEPIGCEIAKGILTDCGYSDNDIEKICNMIMATAIPQNPQNLSEEILCDADLDYLGTDRFEQTAADLRKELAAHGREFTDKEWLCFEIDFLENHQFFTKTSRQTREPRKQQYLRELKDAMAKL